MCIMNIHYIIRSFAIRKEGIMKIVSPKLDYCMKELFRNELILKYFLCDTLNIPAESIKSIRLQNTFLWRRYKNQKLGIMDVLLEINDNTKINIELQIRKVKNWGKRQIFYLSKMYIADILFGENYDNIKKCIGISILDFKPDLHLETNASESNHTIYKLRDENGNVFSDDLEIHVLELRKQIKGLSKMDDWIRFFNAESEEDLDMIKTKNPGILEAIKEVKRMSLSKKMWAIYEAHMKEVRDMNAWKQYVLEEGKAAGMAEGRAEGRAAGMEEGRAAGRAEGMAENILQILEEYGDVSDNVRDLVMQQRDIEILKKWFKLAIKVENIDDFVDKM